MSQDECPICGTQIEEEVLGAADDIGETNFIECPECGTPLTVTVQNDVVIEVTITGKS